MIEAPNVCPACCAQLPVAFPGASLTCACGHRIDVSGGVPGPYAGGPYRSAASSAGGASSVTPAFCPFCGNECPSMVRVCPHCDVRLENVRCQRCFSLQAPGEFACARCGQALELEPLFDATDAPCPRCRRPLEAAPGADGRAHECPRCGGLFVPRDALAEILCAAEIGGALRDAPAQVARASGAWSVVPGGAPGSGRVALEEVRYVSCPLCHTSMNRMNFGKVSGVIVDVCKMHGTWFDAGELTRVVAFAGSGGLARTRERERRELLEEGRAARSRASGLHAQLAGMPDPDVRHGDVDVWRDFLRGIFGW